MPELAPEGVSQEPPGEGAHEPLGLFEQEAPQPGEATAATPFGRTPAASTG